MKLTKQYDESCKRHIIALELTDEDMTRVPLNKFERKHVEEWLASPLISLNLRALALFAVKLEDLAKHSTKQPEDTGETPPDHVPA